MKGLIELGAIGVLEKEGVLDSVHTYVGVSVGAIIALLKVIGYSTLEICTAAVQTKIFPGIQDIDITKMGENLGLMSSDHIKSELNQMVIDKFGFVPNLFELYNLTALNFVAVTYDLRSAKSKHISYLTDPTLGCVNLVMMSANIPGLFYTIMYNDMICADGGFLDPFPIAPYDLGVEEVLIVTIHTEVGKDFHRSAFSYGYRVVQCVMISITERDKLKMTPKCKHLELKTNCADTVGLTVSADTKAQMIIGGHDQCLAFLKEIQSPNNASR